MIWITPTKRSLMLKTNLNKFGFGEYIFGMLMFWFGYHKFVDKTQLAIHYWCSIMLTLFNVVELISL